MDICNILSNPNLTKNWYLFDHFVGLPLKGLKSIFHLHHTTSTYVVITILVAFFLVYYWEWKGYLVIEIIFLWKSGGKGFFSFIWFSFNFAGSCIRGFISGVLFSANLDKICKRYPSKNMKHLPIWNLNLNSKCKSLNVSTASRCILVPFERYGHPNNGPKKVLVTHVFHAKTKLNIVHEYLKTKICSRDKHPSPNVLNIIYFWILAHFWVGYQ